MPTARKYGGRQVEQRAVPGERLQSAETPTSTGAGLQLAKARMFGELGEQGARVAGVFGDLAKEAKNAADQTAVFDANTQRDKWANKRLYDPETGALLVKGKDAMPLPESVNDEYRKIVGDLAAGLSNDRQRQAFARASAGEEVNLDATLRRHVAGEIETYQKGVLQATVETATSNAVANANDPRRIGQELQKATDAIATLGPHVGLSAEQREVATRKAATAIHTGVIERLLANDQDKAARVYFEETKSAIDGDAIARVEKALDEGTLRGSSQRKADEILQKGGTLTAQLEQVRAIDDPKLRDAVRERVEHEAAIKERADREAEEATSTQAYNLVDKTHDVASIPPAMWANFTGSTKSALRSYAEHLARGVPVETNNAVYYGYLRMAANEPENFVKTNLLENKHQLDDPEFKQLANLQLSIRQGDRNGADKELAGFRTKQEIVENTLAQYGIDPKDKTMAAPIAELQRMLDRRIDAVQQSGKKASNVEIQQALDGLLSVSATVPGSWRALIQPFSYDWANKTRRLIDMKPGDIPAADRKQLEAAMRKKGLPITDATVLDWWLEHKVRNAR